MRDELHAEASASNVTLGTHNDTVQASDLVLTPEQAIELAERSPKAQPVVSPRGG